MEAVEGWARGTERPTLALWVTEMSEPAIGLYRACGFSETPGKRRRRTTDAMPEIQMTKHLRSPAGA